MDQRQYLTLTILPQQNAVKQNNLSSVSLDNQTFNYNPIVPHLANPLSLSSKDDLAERERKRKESERIRSSNYRQRTNEYKKLGSLKSEKDRVIGVLLLCYPHLQSLESWKIDQIVTDFIASLPRN
jgi:hypothetical protein